MGKELYEEFHTFRKSIRDMDAVLAKVPHPPDWTIRGTLFAPTETSQIQESACAQPVSTALQLASMQLLFSWGIVPSFVVGHSSGEVAAAFAAGHITEAEAIVAAFYRGYCNGINKLDGAMMAVGMGSEEGQAEIEKANFGGKVVVACVNSPVSITMSGDASAVATLAQDLQSRGIFARKLGTGGKAYHSHHMKALGPELERLIPIASKDLPNSTRLKTGATFVSTVTGKPKSEGINATYWKTNMESPVLFSQAADYIIRQGDVHLLEIGPHSALELPLKQVRSKARKDSLPYSNSLTRGQNAVECILSLIGRLFLHGYPVPFSTVNNAERSSTYPFLMHRVVNSFSICMNLKIEQVSIFLNSLPITLYLVDCFEAKWAAVLTTRLLQVLQRSLRASLPIHKSTIISFGTSLVSLAKPAPGNILVTSFSVLTFLEVTARHFHGEMFSKLTHFHGLMATSLKMPLFFPAHAIWRWLSRQFRRHYR